MSATGKRSTTFLSLGLRCLWTIEHFPASEITGMPIAFPIDVTSGKEFEEGTRPWMRQVEAHPADTRVLGNAAAYLRHNDSTKAGELLRRCRSLEPDSPRWARRIGHLYSLEMIGKDEAAKKDWAAMPRAEYEHAQALYTVEHDRLRALPELANMAIGAGDLAAARNDAEEVLARADDGHESEPVHYGNQVLGRIALTDGEVEGAKSRLPESAKTKGSHFLRSFGPSTKLAAELLKRGEKETVLQYLKACYAFWTFEKGRVWLAKWIGQIERGEPIDKMFGRR